MIRGSVGRMKLNTRLTRNGNPQPALEHLEGRVLCSTTINAVDLGSVLAVAGQAISVSIDASSPNGVRAATIFRDVNNNGRFDGGIDQSLGDIFVPNGQGRFVRNIVPQASWGRNVRLGVDAVDLAGQWSLTGPRRVDLVVDQPPTFISADLSATTVNERDLVSITVRAADDTGVRAVTAFVDKNGDGRWTGATDVSLGSSFVMDGSGNFVLRPAAALTWHDLGGTANILVDAVDLEGAWSGAPRLAGAVHVIPVPVIATFTAAWDSVQAGSPVNPLKLTLTTTSGAPAVAATFWLDLDGDGRWTPGTDFSLGDSREQQGNSYILRVPSDLAGRGSVQICANAVSSGGAWALVASAATVAALRMPTITNFVVDIGTSITLGAEALYPPTQSLSGASVSMVDFFADVNFNGVFDAGTDVMVASVAPTSQLSNGAWRHRVILNSTQVAALPSGNYRWYASPRIAIGGGQTVSGAGRFGNPHQFLIGDPILTRVVATINGASNIEQAAGGDAFSVDVTAFVAGGVSAITMFWDTNLNNRWDAGIDIQLAETHPATSTSSITTTLTGTLPLHAGPGAFAAAVVSSDGVWSSVRESAPLNILYIAPPDVVSSLSTADSFAVTLSAASQFGVHHFAAFLDFNGDGIEDAGETVALTAVRTGGTSRSGTWVVTLSTAGLTHGQVYSLRIRAIDAAGIQSASVQTMLPIA